MNAIREYILDGLCCANCAAKIEKEINELKEVKKANINLVNSKLSVSLHQVGEFDLTKKVHKIVTSHEPSVKVIDVTDKNIVTSKGKKEEKHEEEHKLYFIRLGLAIVITLAASLIKTTDLVNVLILLVAYGIVGYDILISAGKNILKGQIFDENFLMAFASLGAFIIGERIEAIAVLLFYSIGELLQDMAVDKSRKNIEGLMDIRPDYANKIAGGKATVVSPEQVHVGDLILVKPGEKIPLDGIVRKGSSFIDTRALTGESVPKEVMVDDKVLSGTINTSGMLEVEVTKTFGESTVAKILEMVQNAGSKKAESEKFITKFARYYTPTVVFIAVVVAILPPLFGFGAFTLWLYRALSFLIISCPCALVISIPLSFFGGIGGGAKHGILIKGGNYLDALEKVDTIVFDKTGTLTKGVFNVAKVRPVDGIEEEQLVRYAAIAEKHSTHPIAKSILSYYENKFRTSIPTADITELAGYGIIAKYNKDMIYAGNEKLMKKYHIAIPKMKQVIGSIVHIARNDSYIGYILISDEVKAGAKTLTSSLKQLGVKKTVMLTGDQKAAAKEVAALCLIDEYQAELLPGDKVEWFDQYKEAVKGKGRIAFVGDGINDAPVLAGADIGIAMGGIGSDAAIEAADVVIMNDDISKIATAIKIARKTKGIVIQNIIFALGFKLLIMVLAFFGITSIWFAIFADVGVALIALMNAMRAMYVK